MNKRHYEHTLPNIRGSLSNTYVDFLHDMLLIACVLRNQLPVFRLSLASTEMMYPPLLFTLLQFVPLNIFQT